MTTSTLTVLFVLLVLVGTYLYYEVLDAQNADLLEQLKDIQHKIQTYKDMRQH